MASWGRHDGEPSSMKWMNEHLEETIEDEKNSPSLDVLNTIAWYFQQHGCALTAYCGMDTATLIGCTSVRERTRGIWPDSSPRQCSWEPRSHSLVPAESRKVVRRSRRPSGCNLPLSSATHHPTTCHAQPRPGFRRGFCCRGHRYS